MTKLIDRYEQAILLITHEQEKIVGKDVAMRMTSLVHNLSVKGDKVQIVGDPKVVLNDLVNQYASLFGKASVEVSKQAIEKLGQNLKTDEIPENLK
ncbi:MAG: hypothetical protein A3F31_05520 [Candidatus Levybacteria bacterium RIFCSPHIGHO2_12_FULL_38_12]|nr:MAG: hypothetical protein A3F31_05520 [Candidatus Levybacteria bacterium RIFCSPHIGHO2_12_FULL_38_12]